MVKKTKGYRKKYPKKGNMMKKSKKKYSKPSTMMIKGPSAVPDRIFLKMKYQQRITMTSSSGLISQYSFSGNSVFDPDYSGSGAQPTGFDQWAAFYNRYVVRGSKCVLQLANVAASNPAAAVETVLVPVNDATGYSTIDDAATNPYAKRVVYAIQNAYPIIKQYISTKKIVGQKDIDDDTYGAAVNASPTDQWFWQINCQSVDRSTTSTQYVYVTLTYYVEFYDRKTLALS